ncbi:DUF6594 domain-containing protein [Microdochium nivale]|nr:DUF6594 domain-containing protein [Microdochium nivale]
MDAISSDFNLRMPADTGLGEEAILKCVVIESNNARPDQCANGSGRTPAPPAETEAEIKKNENFIAKRMLTEEMLYDTTRSGFGRATARQHLNDNPPMYRGHSQENHRLYFHLEQKIEVKYKMLRLADKKSEELTMLQVSTGTQGSRQSVTRAEEKPTGVELPREHELELQAWVKKAHEHPDLHSQMRQELEKETEQCLEEMAVLLRLHSDVVERISRLQSHTRVDRIPWSKHVKALSSDIALEAPENDFLWYADDYIRLDDRHTPLGLDFVMYNQGYLAKAIRWWLKSVNLASGGNSTEIHLDTARWRKSWTAFIAVSFALVMILPAATMLIFELSVPLSIGVVTAGGIFVVVAATTVHGQPVEFLFVMFCSYMAVMMAVVVGLGDDSNKHIISLADVCRSPN